MDVTRLAAASFVARWGAGVDRVHPLDVRGHSVASFSSALRFGWNAAVNAGSARNIRPLGIDARGDSMDGTTAAQLAVLAAGDSQVPKSLQIASSVVATVATIVTGVVSYRAGRTKPIDARREQLETQKLELEVREKQIAQGLVPGDQQALALSVSAESRAVNGQIALNLVLRFVFLYLVLSAWSVIANFFYSGAHTVVYLRWVSFIPEAVTAVFVVVLGWPLLLDVARVLGIELPQWVKGRAVRGLLLAVGVISALVQSVVPFASFFA